MFNLLLMLNTSFPPNQIPKVQSNTISKTEDEKKFFYPIVNPRSDTVEKRFIKFSLENVDVFSTKKGIILFAGKDPSLPGYTMILYHSPGYVSIYSNLKEISFIKGDLIRNVSSKIGISDKYVTFCIKKITKNQTLEDIDFKKMLVKR